MLLVIAILCFLVIFLLFYAAVVMPREREETAVKNRVQALRTSDMELPVDEMNKPLVERLLHPLANSILAFVKEHTPRQIYNNVLRQADLVSENLRGGVDGFVILWSVSMASIPLLTAYKLFIATPINPLRALVGVFVAFVVGMLLPLLYLRQLLNKRRQSMLEDLPDILDLLAISVQAGLGLDGALQKVVEKMNNPLSREMLRMLRELRMGITRRQALERLADRCEIMEISLFASAVIQSERMGIGIAKVIEVQAENMRNKKLQIIREKAAKMPLKLMLPTIGLIFPTVFIVVLGPQLVVLFNLFFK